MKRWVEVMACVIFPCLAYAGDVSNAYDFETITVTSTTESAFTASKLAPTYSAWPKRAFVTVETADIRFRVDGSTPTQTVGHWVQTSTTSGSGFWIEGEADLRHFYAVGVGATATLQVTYER